MAEIDIKGQLRERFAAPLEHYEHRRVVIWHDPSGEFAEEFSAIAEDPASVASAGRPLRALDSRDFGPFELKRQVLREACDQDLLLYADWPLDLSGGALAGDWLADVELWAGHFQADWLSLLVSEMGAEGAAREGFARFAEFFRAKGRRQRFSRLVPRAGDAADVALGVIACALDAGGTGLPDIALALVDALDGGHALPADLGRYGADAALAALLKARLGYEGPLDDRTGLLSAVAVSALSCTLPEAVMAPLSGLVSRGREEACLALWREWQERLGDEGMEPMARLVEEERGIPGALVGTDESALAESDVLPCTGEAALAALMGSLSQGADRAAEALATVARMRDLSWRSLHGPFLDALEAAARMRGFQSAHAAGFHASTAREAWDAYTGDWYRMDSRYRALLTAEDAAARLRADAPDAERDALEALCDWADNLYVNWFLRDTTDCWASCAERQWEEVGHVREVPRQAGFWDDVVQRELAGATRVAVVVSDALRYEVGAELAERLSAQTKGTVRLGAMQAAFPSVTEFGMASLLPHARLELRTSDAHHRTYPYAGGIKTDSTERRQEVLRASEPRSVALRFKDLMKMRRAERKQAVGDARVLYVYHNRIDATGEESPTEDLVLGACAGALDDLVAVCKVLLNDLRFNRVVVTADHGFLYTRRPLTETQRVSLAEAGAEVAFAGRRHAVTTEPASAPFLRLAIEYDSDRALYGAAPRGCVRIRRGGEGELYVHGGVSLQELCVPVVCARFSDNRSKARTEQEAATLALLSTSRRVTSTIFRVELWQREPVGGKVLPAEYDLVLEDAGGEPVTDVRRASAALETSDDQRRVTRVQLALRPGRAYSSREPYYLVCRDASGREAWREEFRIEVAIAPIDEFGF